MGRRLVALAVAALLVVLTLRLRSAPVAVDESLPSTTGPVAAPGTRRPRRYVPHGKPPASTTTEGPPEGPPFETVLASRHYDFIFCGNIAGTLGSALQALKAFLIIAYEFQSRMRGRLLVLLPALGRQEYDVNLKGRGVALKNLLEMSPLKQLFDIEEDEAQLARARLHRLEDADAFAETRRTSCSEEASNISVWSLAEVRGSFQNVSVPHMWMGPGKELWMFEQLFENLVALSTQQGPPIRVFWQMQHYSPTQCASFVFNATEQQIVSAIQPRQVQEPCAFVYVSHILHKDGFWPLRSSFRWSSQLVAAKIEAVGEKIGELLQEHRIACANFYVKLLGLTGPDFVARVEQGAAAKNVAFKATRLKKRNCRLCMEGNMEVMQRAAASPLLVAEPHSPWPDVPAQRLRALGRPVVYLHGDVAAKPRWDAESESFIEAPPKISLKHLDCEQIYQGSCVEAFESSDYECWPD